MPWGSDQQADVLRHARWLIARRAALTSLRRGQLARVPVVLTAGAREREQVGALARWTDQAPPAAQLAQKRRADEASIIVLNNGDTSADVSIEPRDLPFAWEMPLVPDATVQAWLLTPDSITRLTLADLTVTLPALSAVVIWRSLAG
jgi:hypothetical protein